MKVNKAIELPNGTVRFEGELTQQETDIVLQLGLTQLLLLGAIPYTVVNDDEEEDTEQFDLFATHDGNDTLN